MLYREIHELPYQSGIKEKFLTLGPLALSLGEAGWMGLGVTVSYKLAKTVPPISFLPFPLGYVHYVAPLIVTYFFSKAKHPSTRIPLWKYIARWVAIRRRPRVFYYRRSNIVQGGDRY